MTGVRARQGSAAQRVAWNISAAARAALVALVAWFALAASASALTITGGPTYSLPGGGSCTVGGIASQTGGATITCTGVSLSSHTNVYFGSRVDTNPIGNTMTGADPAASSAAVFRISSTAAGLITYTSTTTATSLSGLGSVLTSNKLNLTLVGGSATVVGTGGTPANSGTNGDIANLFKLTSGTAFTFRADVRASNGNFAEGQACPAVYDPTHEDSGATGDHSRVNVAFYFSDCGDGTVDSPEQCDEGGANGSSTSCCTSTCTFKASGTVCRTSTGECDPQEVCTGSAGACPANAFTAAGTPCTDGSPPSGGNCKDAQCNGSGTCDQNFANETNGTACAEGDFCTSGDTCQAGVCTAGAGNPCPGADGDADCSETCVDTGYEVGNCDGDDPNGSACTDGLFCTGTETCTAGVCGSSTGDPCPGPDGDGNCSESCNEAADNCTLADLDGSGCTDGLFCNGTDTCSSGACTTHTGDPCDGADGDGDCSETCDESADNCDGNDPNGSACTDGLFCNGTDTCSAGACTTHAGDPCPGPDGDTDCSETCDEGADNCLGADPDGTLCRADTGSCDVQETCLSGSCPADGFEPSGTLCNAGSGDLCDPDEVCTGTGPSCPSDTIAPSGTVCNPGSGDLCDPNEVCSGVADDPCPSDTVSPSGTVCNPGSGDSCDPDEVCSGTADDPCPSDTITPSGTTCRTGSGDSCDPDEVCTGVADATCPADVIQPSGSACGDSSDTDCTDPDTCPGTVAGTCQPNQEPPTTVCRPAADTCDTAEFCDGAGLCDPVDAVQASGTPCRPTAGVCDIAEACDGVSTACPADAFEPSSTQCRSDSGACDVPENCTGSGALCPPDGFEPSGTSCGSGVNTDCDNPDTCDGNNNCQANYEPASTPCTTDGETCTVDECDGGGTCTHPAGNASTECRAASAGQLCDEPEECDGTNPTCPADGVKASGTVCRPDAGDCDEEEQCDGVSSACPADVFTPDGTPCNDPSDTVCSNPDTCLSGACNPNNEPTSFECRAASPGQLCDVAENCDGAGNCPPDGVAASGIPCRAANGSCDVAENCDGVSSACPADGFAPSGTMCMSDSNPCTVDICDGANTCVHPAGNAGATCRADAGVCDVAETCDGLSTMCPADGFEPSGTSCDDNLFCNGADECNGMGSCISAGSPCSGGQTCNEAVDQCFTGGCPTVPDSCITAAKNQLLIKKDATDSAKNKLIWKWLKGAPATQMNFADPINTAAYAFCLYVNSSLEASATIPASLNWKEIGDKGYKYKDKLGMADGVTKGLVKGTGAPNKSKAQIKGKGSNLPVAGLTMPFPMSATVVAQLRNNGNGFCLEGTFSSPLKNSDKQYKAKQ